MLQVNGMLRALESAHRKRNADDPAARKQMMLPLIRLRVCAVTRCLLTCLLVHGCCILLTPLARELLPSILATMLVPLPDRLSTRGFQRLARSASDSALLR